MTETLARVGDVALELSNGVPARNEFPIRRAGILYQVKRRDILGQVNEAEEFLHQSGVEVVTGAVTTEDQMLCQQLDLMITIGGDGTMLRAARCATAWQTPLLGINRGRLGFLSECGPDDWRPTLTAVLEGRWWLEERTTLTAEVEGLAVDLPIALNEVVLARSTHPRAIQVDLIVDGHRVTEIVADAVVVATATGSTAYALAAGGPLLDPRVDALVVTPVAAHLSAPGPLVVPSQCAITLHHTRDVPALLSFDGQVDVPLDVGQKVTVRAAPSRCLFARTRPPDAWYDTLVARLRRR